MIMEVRIMKDRLKAARWQIYVSSILSLIIGLLYVIFPIGTSAALSIIIGIFIIVIAITVLVGGIMGGVGTAIPCILVAILLGALGGWIIYNPVMFATIMPIAVGVMLVIHGVQSVVSAFGFKDYGRSLWWLAFFGGIISVIFGLICVFFAFGVLQVSAIIMGIMMIADSIITIVITIRSGIVLKNIGSAIRRAQDNASAMEVESVVVDDNKKPETDDDKSEVDDNKKSETVDDNKN